VPVTMNVPIPKLLKALAINETAQGQLKSKFAMNLALNGLKIADGGEVLATIPLTANELKSVAAGKQANEKLQQVAATTVAKLLLMTPEEVSSNLGSVSDVVDADDDDDDEEETQVAKTATPTPKAAPKIDVTKAVEAQDKASKVGVFDLSMMDTAVTVPLKSATKMYQPVKATSSGSRYFVIAIADGLKVAARYQHGKLSVRVEGEYLEKFEPLLSEMDLSGNTKSHMSMHLAASDEQTAGKCIGAILAGLGVPFTTPVPLIKAIAGKGS
jgi:hypothetical protein